MPADVNETWREVALTQLLTLVDLTFLDGILSEDKISKEEHHPRDIFVISNIMVRNWHLPLTPSSVRTPTDPLMQTAMECIECLPLGNSFPFLVLKMLTSWSFFVNTVCFVR